MPPPFVGECLSLLTRTPATLNALLRDLPEAWTAANEGPFFRVRNRRQETPLKKDHAIIIMKVSYITKSQENEFESPGFNVTLEFESFAAIP